MLGPLLEIDMSKKCTPLWREAHFRATFGRSDLVLRGRRQGLPTTLHYTNYTTLTYTTLPFTTLHYTQSHYTTLQLQLQLQLQLHHTTLHYSTLHYSTLHYTTLTTTTLLYATLH